MKPWAFFVGVVVLMAAGGGTTLTGLLFVILFAALIAALLWNVHRYDHAPAVTTTIVQIAAYCPGAWQALDKGFTYPISASSDAVALAFLALVSFIAVAVGVERLSTKWFESPARYIEYVATADRPEIGAVSLGVLVALATVAAFRTGLWSQYAQSVKVENGGARLELLYLPLLFGFSVAIGRAALKEVISPEVKTKRLIGSLVLWVLAIVLLFIAQSRRVMVGSLILAVTSAWLEAPRIPIIRSGIVAVGLLGLCGILIVGSYLWRHSGPANDAIDQLRVITERSVDVDDLSKSLSDRLTYLWIDAASIENYQALQDQVDLYDVAKTTIIKATPELLMPDKYATKKIVCEQAYETLGLRTDLPCTPTAEGIIFGGIFGLFVTATCYGLGLALVTALYRRNTFASLVLGAVTMYHGVLIECSAFPIVGSLRDLGICTGLAALFAWIMRFGVVIIDQQRAK